MIITLNGVKITVWLTQVIHFQSKCKVIVMNFSDDYSKLVLMRCNRYIEFHTQQGRYYELRIPRYGRDFEYQRSTCDLLFVGSGSEVVRFNLEQGRFLAPMTSSSATSMNACALNPQHDALLVTGTSEGTVEAWDTREAKSRVARLDCAMALPEAASTLPQVTSLAFKDGLNLAVGRYAFLLF